MAEGAVISDIPVTGPVTGRSLWADARARLLRNKASVASKIILPRIAPARIFGHLFTAHPFDRVYPDYVRCPGRLTAYPKAEQIIPQAERIGSRDRARP